MKYERSTDPSFRMMDFMAVSLLKAVPILATLFLNIESGLTREQGESLQTLFNPVDKDRPLARPSITGLKAISQSVVHYPNGY